MWVGAVLGQSGNASSGNFSAGNSVGTLPIGVSGEKLLLGAFSGTKLDVPRLAAARGRARGRGRASRENA